MRFTVEDIINEFIEFLIEGIMSVLNKLFKNLLITLIRNI